MAWVVIDFFFLEKNQHGRPALACGSTRRRKSAAPTKKWPKRRRALCTTAAADYGQKCLVLFFCGQGRRQCKEPCPTWQPFFFSCNKNTFFSLGLLFSSKKNLPSAPSLAVRGVDICKGNAQKRQSRPAQWRHCRRKKKSNKKAHDRPFLYENNNDHIKGGPAKDTRPTTDIMRKSLSTAYRPLTRSVLSRPALPLARRLATSAATSTEPTILSTHWGRFYLSMGCATTAAWGALVFANEWDEGGRRRDSTAVRIRNASAALATKSFVVVGLGAIWPLAPLFLNACYEHLAMEEECREIRRQRKEDRRRERRAHAEKMARERRVREEREQERKRLAKEECERREKEARKQDQKSQGKKALDKGEKQHDAAVTYIRIPIEAKEGGIYAVTETERALCRWCLQAH